MEEVKENVRYKVTGRSVGTSEFLNKPSAQPTVGAGGQYQVNVQSQPEGGMAKLARGLSAFSTTLGALASAQVAQEEIAEKREAELSLEESHRLAELAREQEDRFFTAGGFIDRMVRTGKASAQSNPLFYSRGRRAYGIKVAEQRYASEVSQALHDAQQAYKKDPAKTYSVNEIQNSVAERIKAEYGITDTASSESGFNQVAAKMNTQQTIRDVEAQDKITRTHSIIHKADEIASVIIGSELMSPEQILQAFKRSDSFDNSLSAKDNAIAFKMAMRKGMDRNPIETKRFIDARGKGQFADLKMGGYSLSSTVYQDAFDDADNLYEQWERDTQRKNDISDNKIEAGFKRELNAVYALDYSEPKGLRDILGENVELSQEQEEARYSEPEEMAEAMKDYQLGKHADKKSVVLSAYSDFDSNADNRAYTKKNKKLQELNGYRTSMRDELRISDANIAERQAALGSSDDRSTVAMMRADADSRMEKIVKTGKDINGEDVMIGDRSWSELSGSPEDEQLKLDYLTALMKNSQNEQQAFIDERSKKQLIREAKQELVADKSKRDDTKEIENKFKEIYPKDVASHMPKSQVKNMQNSMHLLAGAMSKREEDMRSEKYLRHPYNRGNIMNAAYVLQNSKNVTSKRAVGGGYGSVLIGTESRMDAEAIQKANTAARELFQRAGITMAELETLDSGYITVQGKSFRVTDEILAGTPLIGDGVDFEKAARIMNKDFGSFIDSVNLRENTNLHQSILTYRK